MNIGFSQVERKSRALSPVLAVLVVLTVLMLVWPLSPRVAIHLSLLSAAGQAAQAENGELLTAIPAPRPPADQTPAIIAPGADGGAPSVLAAQIVPAPAPSVP